MSDIVKRLQKVEDVERELAHECDMPPEGTANWGYAEVCKEAARTIEILRVELTRVNMENDRLTRTNRAKREHRDKLLQEVAILRAALSTARADALDEAARVADAKSDEWDTEWRRGCKVSSHLEGMSDGAHDCAAAIRALAATPKE